MIFIDETIFTRKALKKSKWTRPGENAEVDDKLLNDSTKALLMGVSAEKEVEQYMIFKKSVTTDRFLQYLELVRRENGVQKVALFLDNLSVHRSKKARAKMEELGILPIFNIVYQCELQPIELVFSKLK